MKNIEATRYKLRGFTLVEMIVVLVILAILLAILVPSMTQWITKAKNEAAFQECRQAVLATQTYAIEKYAKEDGSAAYVTDDDWSAILTLAQAPKNAKITTLTMDNAAAQVNFMLYKTASGIRVKYDNGTYSISSANLGDADVRQGVLSALDQVLNVDHPNTGSQVDSGAAAVSSTCNTAFVNEALKKNGLTLAEMDAVCWHYDGKNKFLYWTDRDITNYSVGEKVPVIRYNMASKTYTVWIATIALDTTATGGNKTYNVLRNYTQYKPSTDNAQKQTHADAVAFLAEAQAKYPRPTPTPGQ